MQVLGIGKHSETLEEMVIYRHLYHHDGDATHGFWVRPVAMFLETVTRDGYGGPRFQFISAGGPFACEDCGAEIG